MIRLVSYLVLGFASVLAQALSPAAQPRQQEAGNPPQLSASAVAQLQTKADAGDASAQTTLGKAYQDGNGVPQNDALAATWFRKAADQGDPYAENDLGILLLMGRGVGRDKQEAVRWYRKAAKQGSPQAMFNLGASYYNGEGVDENELSAYAWFLLAQDAGNKAADDAVQRSSAAASPKETADTLMRVAEMYETGDELPQSYEQSLRWLRKAAQIDPRANIRIAILFLNGPDASQHYGETLATCKASAKDYAPSQSCLGYIYRKGLGVKPDPAEAIKWYRKAVAAKNTSAMLALAEMYAAGEGTKADRPAAFVLFFRAALLSAKGAQLKASDLLRQMDKPEIARTEKKLREQNLDPAKVFTTIETGAHS